MARKDKHRKRLNFIAGTLALLLICFCVLCSLDDKYNLGIGMPKLDSPSPGLLYEWIGGVAGGNGKEIYGNALEVMGDAFSGRAEPGSTASVKVHFIDVGQAKCILIQAPEKNVLIDAGETDTSANVLSYLKGLGVKRLDAVIGTHPHSDHIGGMDTVIESFDIGTIILPDIPEEIVPTTKTYTDLLTAIAKKGLKITPARPGEKYELGDGAMLTMLAPIGEYNNLNNISAASKLDYGATSFLFTGDCEKEAESDMLASGHELKADVLDIGHHGSATSSTEAFIKAVSPKIAVFSCGIDNTYGHPVREIVERIRDFGAKIYRTDLDGTVIVSSDGKTLDVSVSK